MAYVSIPNEDELTEEAKQFYDAKIQKDGSISNMTHTLLRSMKSFYALEFYPIRDEMVKIVGSRATYFYCYAISSENECLVCTTYHARLLKHLNLEPGEFTFSDVEKVLIDYGRGLVNDPNRIDPSIFDRLKHHFSEPEIVLITTVGCKMIASNIFNSALQIDLDEYLYEVEFEKNIIDTLSGQ